MDYYNICSTLLKSFWVVGPFALFYNAPFGRFGDAYSKFSLNGKWTWFVMELLSPLSFLMAFLTHTASLNTPQITISCLFLTHYINRAVIYPLLNPSQSPSHLLVLLSAATFNIANGSLQGRYVGEVDIDSVNPIGLLLMALGFAGNVYHDSILFKLKKQSKGDYAIPQGGLFYYVSYPNYFCEWVEWGGYALITHSTSIHDPPLTFLLALLATMTPRAYKGHQWYKSKFDYPTSRKIVFPFIF